MLNVKSIKFQEINGRWVLPFIELSSEVSYQDVKPECKDVITKTTTGKNVYAGFDPDTGLFTYKVERCDYHNNLTSTAHWQVADYKQHWVVNDTLGKAIGEYLIDVMINGICATITAYAFSEILQELGADSYTFSEHNKKLSDTPSISVGIMKVTASEKEIHNLFVRCPKCGEVMDLWATSEVDYVIKHDKCMACAFEEQITSNEQLVKTVMQSAVKNVHKNINASMTYNSTQAITKMIDEALDNGNKEEFLRLTNLLKGGGAEK